MAKTGKEDRGLYAHHDRGYKRAPRGFGPGAYGYEGRYDRRIGATVEDDYSDQYGYGSSFGESRLAHHNTGWADEGSADSAAGSKFSLGHAGRGPKGYRRSDERVHDDVCEALTHNDELDASDMEVSVSGGIVTLLGTVPDRRSKKLAEHLIDHLPGVVDVPNRLTLKVV